MPTLERQETSKAERADYKTHHLDFSECQERL